MLCQIVHESFKYKLSQKRHFQHYNPQSNVTYNICDGSTGIIRGDRLAACCRM